MTREELRAHAASLRATDVLLHVERRGWVQVRPPNEAVWLLGHPDHMLRQLIIPRDEGDPQYVDALLDVMARLADVERVSETTILLELLRPSRPFTERDALESAVQVAQSSPCAKSQRGVVVFSRSHGVLGRGFNTPPPPFRCDGSAACRANCNKLAVHAEMAALHGLLGDGVRGKGDLEMLHVKVVAGVPVASGAPSCWQCSRDVVASGIRWFWLLHEHGLRRYAPDDFHAITLRNSGLPVIR